MKQSQHHKVSICRCLLDKFTVFESSLNTNETLEILNKPKKYIVKFIPFTVRITNADNININLISICITDLGLDSLTKLIRECQKRQLFETAELLLNEYEAQITGQYAHNYEQVVDSYLEDPETWRVIIREVIE